MSKRKTIPIEELSPQVESLCEVLNEESDLPRVLISASFLDEALAALLEKRLVATTIVSKALASSGWIGTYGARSELAYCLGLITKGLYLDLVLVGEIRNRFAHSHLSVTFDDTAVQELCMKLTYPRVQHAFNLGSGEEMEAPPWPDTENPRSRFTIVVLMLANRLILTGLGVDRLERPNRGGWE